MLLFLLGLSNTCLAICKFVKTFWLMHTGDHLGTPLKVPRREGIAGVVVFTDPRWPKTAARAIQP